MSFNTTSYVNADYRSQKRTKTVAMYTFLFNTLLPNVKVMLHCPECCASLAEDAVDDKGNAILWKCILCKEVFSMAQLKTMMAQR